jgi:Zn-dependent protease
LLPPSAPQHAAVAARLDGVSRPLPDSPARSGAAAGAKKQGWKAAAGGAIVVLLSKAKLLLLGLTKLKTMLSMLAFVGVYWGLYGWPLAVGFVLSIYVHEMGHVAALSHLGIRASAPMFIPGFGTFVKLEQPLRSTREDAIVGLAGPLWGLGAALTAYAVYLATGAGIWGAIASLGAWINLFNLMPVWQLDGARGFAALSRPQRWMACLTAAGAALLARQPVLWAVAAIGVWRAFQANAEPGDRRALVTYVGLVIALAAIWFATLSVAGVQ